MQTARLIGRFMHSDQSPAQGEIRILPQSFWHCEKGKLMAYRGAEAVLDDGCFDVKVSVGDYIVVTPFGRWEVTVPSSAQPLFLRDLIAGAKAK